RRAGTQGEHTRGPSESEHVTLDDLVEHPVRDATAGNPFHGRREVRVGVWRARHRVAAEEVVVADAHAERAELPGLVREVVTRFGWHVEDERLRVVRFLHDPLDAQRMEP